MDRAGDGKHGGDGANAGDEPDHLRLRSELMARIVRLMGSLNMNQRQAARFFGVSPPRMSDLVRGKRELFSIDGLVRMLTRHAPLRVDLVVRRRIPPWIRNSKIT